MKKLLLAGAALLLAVSSSTLVASPSFTVLNGSFESGLTAWRTTGDVHVETNRPLEGKASAVLGPGAGSLAQRIEIGSGNDFTLSATVQSERTNGYVFAIRFLDNAGHELMRVDSLNDIKRDKKNPLKFDHFMQAHPLTRWIEVVFSKDSTPGSVIVDQVELNMTDENAADLKPTCNLDEEMQPFWLGKTVNSEAVLMLSENGKPASGQLMYRPTRIISVQDYGLATNYSEGTDYTVNGRTLVCTASSRMMQVRNEDLLKGEYQWNVVGGKQVMVTYEHDDTWYHPRPSYLGDGLPMTVGRLKNHAPLKVVAYGDSITHGLGGSRLSHLRPYLPPWPELFVNRLKQIYHGGNIKFYNSAQSGADSKWADRYATRMVASLNPDLVIVAFGQNDFWSISANTFANDIADVIKTVRHRNPDAEFLLVSTMRYDPAYTTNAEYWNVVGKYADRLKAMTGPGVQFVDMTAISGWVFTAKKPKDCINDPLHPNDYLARWYAQSLVATLDPDSRQIPSTASNSNGEKAGFDAAPYGIPLPEGNGLMWDDPREIHSVTVDFADAIPAGSELNLEYWGSHWPKEHLPKDHELGNGWSGWLELGNWYNGGWRVADAVQSISGNSIRFTFRPVNQREFPDLKDYASTGRFTLKIRVTGDQALQKIIHIRAVTDSTLEDRAVRIAWEKGRKSDFHAEAFNGEILSVTNENKLSTILHVCTVFNNDPNTFDRTLVTVKNGTNTFTFKVDDLKDGTLYLPEYGAAILPDNDGRDFAAFAEGARRSGKKTLYDQIAAMPEQTWGSAWNGMPPKKTRISFIIGMDGSRQKFCVDRDGLLSFHRNDHFMQILPAKDTLRLALEGAPVKFAFGLPDKPVERHLEDDSIPTLITTWERDGIRITQTTFATTLDGVKPDSPPPAPDSTAVAMLRFDFTNTTGGMLNAALPIFITNGAAYDSVRIDSQGLIENISNVVRGQIVTSDTPVLSSNGLVWNAQLAPHQTKSLVIKVPYLPLVEISEAPALKALDFDREQSNTGDYWRRVLNKSASLITPEPVLNNFYRAVAGHLLINSEMEPGTGRRFARVSSFNYGVYGNESCMMVLDLDRRGYHQEAADCLETWLHYQGTVSLPGNFDSKQGVLYGASGYESGGYNQHHGWILWTLVEHYRFTHDEAWLRHAAPGIIAGADWIIRESGRTSNRTDLAEGLLPPGDLEDIGDWWNWLSTSCYTWRGLDSAAWVLEQIHHPEAARIRSAADHYHQKLLEHFFTASARSPVVRLRDGTAVPQVPSYVQRRGRSFGWICETLEGAMHLMITRAIDPKSTRAQWILKDYEDNLFLSNQYGYTLDDFDKYWFGRGGMSMQACLLFDVETYLYRDDVKQALRAMFNAIALNHFPDVHMNTEHALPEMGDWAGDQYKTSDEGNACGWLRFLFVREEGDTLLIGQAVPRDWLAPGKRCGIENTATYFGNASVIYEGAAGRITAALQGPVRNPPREIRLRFRTPGERSLVKVTVNGRPWTKLDRDWVILPGNIGVATVVATY